MRGLFITFEGGEGCGKTTISNAVAQRLDELGIEYIRTREPGGTPIAEKIRNLLLDPENAEMTPETEALLYAAARSQHTLEKIQPALNEGKIVLCDRYIGSSFAYQGLARNLGTNNIAEINDFGIHGFRPDIQFFINTPVNIALERMAKRGKLDRLEMEDLSFHYNVYNAFKWEVLAMPYVVELDGLRTIDEIADEAVRIIQMHLDEIIENE